MTTYRAPSFDIISHDGQFTLIHPVGPDEIFDSFDELVEAYPCCEESRSTFFDVTAAQKTPVVIRNEFTGHQLTVDASLPLTVRTIQSWRLVLQGPDCTSGDDIGGRGPQADPEAYEALLLRAQQVIATGRDE